MAPSVINSSTASSSRPTVTSHSPNTLEVNFGDLNATFHAQWLHDARCDLGSERKAPQAYCEDRGDDPKTIEGVNVSGDGAKTTINVTWNDSTTTAFPAVWLRLLAPTVAKVSGDSVLNKKKNLPPGWKVKDFVVPEVSYEKIMGENVSQKDFFATKAYILDTLLLDGSPGLLKVTDLPEVDTYTESTQVNNLVTAVLKKLFTEVFQHSMRPPDATFKIASHYQESANRIKELPNYDTSEILLPHADHSHYDNPVRVQGFHCVQGTSETTFIHACAALQTLNDEDPDLFETLSKSPYILGRVAQFYAPALFQTTVDTAFRKMPGYPDQFKAIRWHPHLAGYLLTPFEQYEKARLAQRRFQEIMRNDEHQVKLELKPGDMYIWDNFRILHGRERIFSTPRLAVGQTVIEQVVNDHYRVKEMAFLTRYIGEHWLVQTPTWELDNLVKLVKEVEGIAE